MSLFKKIGDFAKKAVKSVGKVAAVALPVAALGASLLPGVGGAVSTGLSKLGEKLKGSKVVSAVQSATSSYQEAEKKGFLGIGDGKKGIFGIGDGEKGIFGIGTGKGKAKKALEERSQNETLYAEEDEADKARLVANGRWGGRDRDSDSGSGSGAGIAIAAGLGLLLLLRN